jgi:hypothetical protein
MDKTVELQGGFGADEDKTVPEEHLGELFPPLEPLVLPATPPARAAAPAAPPAAFRPTPSPASQMPPRAAPPLASKPAAQAPVKPTPPSSLIPASSKPGAGPKLSDVHPDDFDKTVILTGGFEAQPPEEEAPPFDDDLFPPIKF